MRNDEPERGWFMRSRAWQSSFLPDVLDDVGISNVVYRFAGLLAGVLRARTLKLCSKLIR